ncbi:class I SAM-dependent DNA methyltransferase [Limnochorda sp.]|jgi:SAM-dependent methyltransferase|uniref:class I SAM-dependent DNA methyltransferase n=1 Tax=Limnochorda sp. TaxID=1940279 RepID=UPI00179ADAA9|nr:class I SAM-dependent methyltransferase [Bacillota bacterium]MBO2518817.1 class I SAM-dependent methyltransferase [Bacillota bacterium]NMA72191.1 class I SAM-dependent methyltransferase [Bacillota bacterium]
MTGLEQADVYREFASIYDEAGFSTFSQEMVPYTLALLEHLGWTPPARTVLDLACGTGTAALEFFQRGWQVAGLDRSEAMLAVARQKAAAQGVEIDWRQGDMRTFTVAQPFGLVTCFFDALNYLLAPEELAQTFRQVHEALLPGGLFVCDVNTPQGLEAGAAGEAVEIFPRLVTFMRERYDAENRLARVRLSFYVADAGGYRRLEEIHVERGYTFDEVGQLLHGAGFTEVRLFDCFTFDPPVGTSHRVAAVARRG